jgi:hypothetical protein
MAEEEEGKEALDKLSDLELAWIGEHRSELRRSGQRLLRTSLVAALVIGLAAHVGGYLLRSATTTEPLGLVADLLYALGWALWTGAVVVVFTQVFPETKKRQIVALLDAYDAEFKDQTPTRQRRGERRPSADQPAER